MSRPPARDGDRPPERPTPPPGNTPPRPSRLRLLSLASGSTGNCFVLELGGELVLIDSGLSRRRVEADLRRVGLDPARIRALVLTHEHGDHVSGAGPLARRYGFPVLASRGTLRAGARRLGKLPRVQEVDPRRPFLAAFLEVTPLRTFHDAADPFGVVVETEAGARAGVLTDIGRIPEAVARQLEGVSALALETNHDLESLRTGPYPWHLKRRIASDEGHLPNHEAVELAARLLPSGLRRMLAAHLSRENNSPELVRRAFDEGLPPERRRGLDLHVSGPDEPSVALEVD